MELNLSVCFTVCLKMSFQSTTIELILFFQFLTTGQSYPIIAPNILLLLPKSMAKPWPRVLIRIFI